MGTFRRYRTAWSRLHRSNGFGIHSPFAFRFVLDVLRERLPYYAYDEIHRLRRGVIAASSSLWRHPRVISFKNAKMLFRIVNYFNPPHILQVGTSYGVSTACMLRVSSSTRLTLYEPHLDRYPVVRQVLEPYGEAVSRYDDVQHAIKAYYARLADDSRPFVLVNDLPQGEEDYAAVQQLVHRVVDDEGVIVMRNLSRNPLMKKLWQACAAQATHGQIFTNEKLAVVVASRRLQREDFLLWF